MRRGAKPGKDQGKSEGAPVGSTFTFTIPARAVD